MDARKEGTDGWEHDRRDCTRKRKKNGREETRWIADLPFFGCRIGSGIDGITEELGFASYFLLLALLGFRLANGIRWEELESPGIARTAG